MNVSTITCRDDQAIAKGVTRYRVDILNNYD